jgi:hypothetical protein
MKARLLLILITLALLAGCAQGYNENPQPAYQEEPATQWYPNPYKNPETEQEYEQRIWREEIRSGPFI